MCTVRRTFAALLMLCFSTCAVAAESWTGIYLGGTAGRRLVDATWETTCLQDGFPGNVCPDGQGVTSAQFAHNNPLDLYDKSTRLGGYGGAQFQLQSFVFGIEGDWAKANNQLKTEGIPGAEFPGLGDQGPDNADIRADWDASVRGRLGFLLTPALMIYGTGGLTWMKLETSVFCGAEFPAGWCSLANVGKTERDSEVVQGTTWGGGVEALIYSNWMLRAEWRHARYDGMNSIFFDGVLNNADAISTTIETETNTISLGLAYKF